jgi:hypothetical protein
MKSRVLVRSKVDARHLEDSGGEPPHEFAQSGSRDTAPRQLFTAPVQAAVPLLGSHSRHQTRHQ